MFSTSDFPTRRWKKASPSHGWRVDAGHVIFQDNISKYLENHTYVTCKNYTNNYLALYHSIYGRSSFKSKKPYGINIPYGP